MKKVLIIGSGGREHALAWKLSQSARVGQIILAPGNDGMPEHWTRWTCDLSLGKSEFVRLAELCKDQGIDLAVVGPDNPLADGIVDIFEQHGIPTFGPSQKAAQIEASKAFAKDVMKSAAIPTAQYRVVKDLEEAQKFLKSVPWPPHGSGWVIKADGLALGKGVVVCDQVEQALEAARKLITVSGSLVIEEKLQGEELSWMAICDGQNFALLPPARDYKRLADQDQGPNTGGMGAYCPVPGYAEDPSWSRQVGEQVFVPALRELSKRGAPFKGLLYAGLMVDRASKKFWVLEFNSRFGDPETQAILPVLASDLYEWLDGAARGKLDLKNQIQLNGQKAVYIVAAASGYPDYPKKGTSLGKASLGEGVFSAGLKKGQKALEVSGGRVLGALGLASNFLQAREQAYRLLEQNLFEGAQYRKDIAKGVVSP